MTENIATQTCVGTVVLLALFSLTLDNSAQKGWKEKNMGGSVCVCVESYSPSLPTRCDVRHAPKIP